MTSSHYSIGQLAGRLERDEHLLGCEQCRLLLALVRRARGEPSDEQTEVTVDALEGGIDPRQTPHSEIVDDNLG